MIIGITGTIGAGKGTVVEYLKKKGFSHYSVRDFLLTELERRGLPKNRDSLNTVGESLRAAHGGSFIIDSLYAKARNAGGDAVIESVRAVAEVRSLKEKGAYLLAVDANPHVRYKRIVRRGSETDDVSFERFLADEQRESESDEPTRMNIPRCMALADFTVMNDGSIGELRRQVDGVLARVGRT